MFNITWRESLFSFKCFIAASLALYISFYLGFSRPFWAMSTAYIVSQSCSGEVRSKATYRLVGTIIGATVALLFFSQIIHSLELTLFFLTLWLAVCLFISVLDRKPSAYLFMLSGYTTIMIIIPVVNHPQDLFNVAISRSEEIIIGILCAVFVHSVVFPESIQHRMLSKIDELINHIRTSFIATYDQITKQTLQKITINKIHGKLAADLTNIQIQNTHLKFDTGLLQFSTAEIDHFQFQFTDLVSRAVSIEHKIQLLQEYNLEMPEQLVEIMNFINTQLFSGQLEKNQYIEFKNDLTIRVHRFQQSYTTDSNIQLSIIFNLTERLIQYIDKYINCLIIRDRVYSQAAGEGVKSKQALNTKLHTNFYTALISATAATIALGICSFFWFITGWPQGGNAMLMAGIFASLFAAQDNPLPTIKTFLRYTIFSIPLSAIYILVILPAVVDFSMLLAVLFPACFLIGVFMARANTTGRATAIILGFTGTLSLHDTQHADIVTFLNNITAQIFGILIIITVISIMRNLSSEWIAKKLQKSNWSDIYKLTHSKSKFTSKNELNIHPYLSLITDRIGLIENRRSAWENNDEIEFNHIMNDLKLTRDILELKLYHTTNNGDLNSFIVECIKKIHLFYKARLMSSRKIDDERWENPEHDFFVWFSANYKKILFDYDFKSKHIITAIISVHLTLDYENKTFNIKNSTTLDVGS